MNRTFFGRALRAIAVALTCASAAQAADEAAVERIDYLTFAQGAVPLSIGGDGAKLGANFEHAVKIIDGSPLGFVVVNKGKAETSTEFVYELPAATTFDRFAVPHVLETPSPSATFTRVVEVYGSSKSASDGYDLLASATLATHKKKGDVTELKLAKKAAVRWVKLKLAGGIDLPRGEGALEFSEIIGNGTQEPAAFSDKFKGIWKQGSNVMDLAQEGAVVSGCYDRTGDLTGTVSGSVLRATGLDRSDKTKSAFILSIAPDGQLRGVRSSNGGPFRLYTTPVAAKGTKSACATPAVKLGCGSIIHGINFDFDSAVIRKDAEPVLLALYDGLKGDTSASINIEGHTSSEGTTAYNQTLSQNRANAVVADLVKRGIASKRLGALGVGEVRPIASNNDENGRAMNRRVEVVCK
jgi:outer membrane protein OmpA-like peptidoglycan-associated protein